MDTEDGHGIQTRTQRQRLPQSILVERFVLWAIQSCGQFVLAWFQQWEERNLR